MILLKKLSSLLMMGVLIVGLAGLQACGKRGDPYASQPAASAEENAKPVKVDNKKAYPAPYQDEVLNEPKKKKFLGIF